MSTLHNHVAIPSAGAQRACQNPQKIGLNPIGTFFAGAMYGEKTMSLVRLLGFATLDCGCVVGRYRELATSREVSYVEEKGTGCSRHAHRRNHTLMPETPTVLTPVFGSARAL